MSTFDGIVDEFPSIRIDHFRRKPDATPPQACFLSHIHSDHLQGLESLKMPFVYCSEATKRILLRLEKYPHRINFAKRILEARKQTYKALKLVLRALPIETPVEIELDPKTRIRVTLFDANHCPGAVMFLIEGNDKAILYTGDVRAEPWWVNSIVRNPILLPYTCGARTLDCIYLDTTFASHSDIYKHFPTKAEGLAELLKKVGQCPITSTYYFRSWTFGYEDVWLALSNFFRSQIHVDDYQLRIFRSLADDVSTTVQGPSLAGFAFGNQYQQGCLTDDSTVMIHSCEPGTACHDRIKTQKDVVWITPIISRLKDGTEIAEIGAGGGGGDLYQTPQLELVDSAALEALRNICGDNDKYKEALTRLELALSIARDRGDANVPLEGLGLDQDENLTLKQFLQLISTKGEHANEPYTSTPTTQRTIHFPYSRHSSFSELRHLVSSFPPKDICPCTVDIDIWSDDISIETLFGDLCSEAIFKYDQVNRAMMEERQEMQSKKRKREEAQAGDYDTQRTETQDSMDTEEAYRSAKTSMARSDPQPPNPPQSNQAPHERRSFPPPKIRRFLDALAERSNYEYDENYRIVVPTANTRDCPLPVSEPQPPITNIQETVVSSIENDYENENNQSQNNEHGNHCANAINDHHHDNHEDNENEDNDNEDNNLLDESSTSPSPPSSPSSSNNSTPPRTIFRLLDSDPLQYPRSHSYTHSRRPKSRKHPYRQPQTDGPADTPAPSIDDESRIDARVAAYRAARAVLKGDVERWTDLRLRSLGWRGHVDEEVEL